VIPSALAETPRKRERSSEDPESALIEAARGGDPAAFTRIYRLHATTAFARLTRLLGPIAEREDLLQKVFLELHRALRTFRGDASLGTFVRRITAHVALGYLRSWRRRPAVPLEPEHLASMIAPGLPPDEAARARQDLRQLLDLLDRLRPKKRLAFVLVAVEGLSCAEAGIELGASADAVKQRVLAARRELKAMLARKEAR